MSASLIFKLSDLYDGVISNLDEQNPVLRDQDALSKVVAIVHNLTNRALIRFLMSCLAAKIDNPSLDVRKPYTEIGGNDSFSGRTYDQDYIMPIINMYNLPLNSTTAFLTPTFRNHNVTMTPDLNLERVGELCLVLKLNALQNNLNIG